MSVRTSIFWAFIGQFVSFTTMLATSIIIARLLNPREMGIYAVAFATMGVLQMVAAFDLSSFVVREKELDPEAFDTAFTVNTMLYITLAVLTYLISFAGAAFLGDPAVAHTLQLLAIGPLIVIFEFRPIAMLQRTMHYKWIAIINAVRTVASGVVTLGAAYMGYSYLSSAFGYIAFVATGAIGANIAGARHASFRFNTAGWRVMAVFGMRMMSITGITNLALRISDILLGRLIGLTALGLYSRATSVSTIIYSNLYSTATRIVFLQLAQDYRETGILRDTFLRGIQLITAVMWPMLIGLALLSKPVVVVLFGARWLPAAMPLSLLLVAQFFLLCFGMNWELFVLRDETARQMRFETIRAVVGLALFVLGASISIDAAAGSRIAEAFVGMALYLPHMNRMAGTTTRDLLNVYGQSALLTVAAVTPAALLMISNGWSADTRWSLVGMAIALGILLWLIAIAVLRHPIYSEMTRLLRRFVPAV